MAEFEHLKAPYSFKEFYSNYPEGYSIYEAILEWLEQFNGDIGIINEVLREWELVDSKIFEKADKTYVDSQDILKADKTYVDSQDSLKSDKTYVDSQLAGIVTSGSNTTGRYVRFSDGTQICYHSVTTTFVNDRMLSTTWTYPMGFISIPSVIATPRASINSDLDYETIARATPNVTTSLIRVTAGGVLRFASGATYIVDVVSIGRWK